MNHIFKKYIAKIDRYNVISFFVGILLFFIFYLFSQISFAATVTWDGGGGGDTNWTTCANWSDDTCPTSLDTVVFDGTSTNNSTIDADHTLTGFTINSGYTGTITQGDTFDITISANGTYTQSDGTFIGGAATMTFGGSFTINSGGTFTAATTTKFAHSSNIGIDVNTSQTFENLEFAGPGGVFIGSGDTLVVTATTTFSANNSWLSAGTIDARGDIVSTGTGFNSNSTILELGSSNAQRIIFRKQNAYIPARLNLDSADDASDTIEYDGVSIAGFSGLITTSGFSGTMSLTNATSGSIFLIGRKGLDLSGGTVEGGRGTWEFAGNLVVNTGGTFTAATTTKFAHSSNITINVDTTQTFENIDFAGPAGVTISSGDTLVVTATTTFSGNNNWIFTGTIDARGDVVSTGTGFSGSSATLELGSSDAQRIIFRKQNAYLPRLNLDSADDASDTIEYDGVSAAGFSGFTTTSGFSGTISLTNATSGSTFLIGTNGLSISGGTVEGGPGTWKFNRHFTINSGGVFIAPTTTIFDLGGSATINVDTTQTFENLEFSSGASLTISSGDTLVVTATTTFSGTGAVNTGDINARGDVVHTSTGLIGAPITFTGTSASGKANQTITLSTITVLNGDITVNKTEGKVQLLSAIDLDATNQDLVITDGTLDLNGFAVTVDGTSGVFTFADGTVLQLQGGETVTANSSYPSFASGSTVEYIGDGDAGADTFTVVNNFSYDILTINTTDSGDIIDASGVSPIDINGNFTLASGSFTAPASITLAGNFADTGGTFTHNSGTVTLDGTSQSITGSNTFYNLSKVVTSADTLTFGADDTQTVTNTWTMTGTSGNVLSLVSASPDTQWKVDPQGTRTVSYLTVTDSNNTNATTIAVDGTVTDGGNNINWGFNNSPNTPSSLGPSGLVDGSWGNDNTPTLTFTTSDDDSGDTVKYHMLIDDSSDFSSPVTNYTSALAAQGSTSFTVGQAAGSGSYAVGSEGQTLSDIAGYYWRVSITDNNGGSSATSTANSGSIAFKIDATNPIVGTLALATTSATSLTASISGASDSGSGLSSTPYIFSNSTASTNSSATADTSWLSASLTPNTSYTFYVQVSDTAGNTANTSNGSIYTFANVPSALSGSADSDTAITVSWEANSNPAGTEYLATNSTSATDSGWTTATSASFSGLICNSSYSFVVKARNGAATETADTSSVAVSTNACPGGGIEQGSGPSSPSSSDPASDLSEPADLQPGEDITEGSNEEIANEVIVEEGDKDIVSEEQTSDIASDENSEIVSNGISNESSNITSGEFSDESSDKDTKKGFERTVLEGDSLVTSIFSSALSKSGEIVSRVVAATKNVINEVSSPYSTGVITLAIIPSVIAVEYGLAQGGLALNFASLGNLWLRFMSLFYGLVAMLGLRTLRRRWGTVYDSQTKQPLDPVLLKLIDFTTGKVIETAISDIHGRFGFLDRPGKFLISAEKSNYKFPSEKITADKDGVFTNLYHGEMIEIKHKEDVIKPNIPMDSLGFDWNQEAKKKIIKEHPKLENIIAKLLEGVFWTGFAFVILGLIFKFSILSVIFAVIYTFLAIIRRKLPLKRLHGRIENYESKQNLILEVSLRGIPDVVVGRALVDKQGRFFLKSPAGELQLKIKTISDGKNPSQTLKTFDIKVGKEGVVRGNYKI